MKRLITTLSQKWPELLLEGIVIVGSILLAIWLENLNDDRKDRLKELKILKELKSEYLANFHQLDEKTSMRNDMIASAHRILYFMDDPAEANRDSLLIYISSILRDPTFDPIQNDLISSGNIRLLRNDSLRQMLSNWTTEVYQLQEVELDWQKVRTDIGANLGINLGIARDFTNILWKDGYTPVEALDQTLKAKRKIRPSKTPVALEIILKSRELEGFAAYVITWNQLANIQGLALRRRIEAILLQIEKGIK